MTSLRLVRRRRGLSLTPMIDVVFLLLVFFMLTAQFDRTATIDLVAPGAGRDLGDVPRLVDVGRDSLRLNGVEVGPADLVQRLSSSAASLEQIVVVRPDETADVQRLVDVLEVLGASGLINVTVVE